MRRMVSVWLPYWRTERLERRRRHGRPHEEADQEAFALTEAGKGGRRLVGVNRHAEAAGVQRGMVLTDAFAILPCLKTMPASPAEEAKDLEKLAAWCRRYTPWTAPRAPDGLALDVTGASHLLGGEECLLDDLVARFDASGLTARAALAGTLGAAWALSRHGDAKRIVVHEGEEAHFIAALPVQGLRLGEVECALLERLGLRTIGQLFDLPREALRARLGLSILLRLDQAIGAQAEPLSPVAPETLYAARLNFPEPITSVASIACAAELLAQQVTEQLKGDSKGARRYALSFYDTQGDVFEISVTLARPSHKTEHVLRLFREKFTNLEGRLDETLAFDAATLYATRVERLIATQSGLGGSDTHGQEQKERLASLLDRLSARLGSEAVTRFEFRESHIPERAAIGVPISGKSSAPFRLNRRRPLLLLPRAELVRVLAEVPDYPPRRFTWRRLDYKVVKAEGPERLCAEWWQAGEERAETRDYYRVEDETGRRFWLYREGLYEGSMPRWYLHGLFA
jgi:protein ImuB